MTLNIPSARDLVKQAMYEHPNADINSIHQCTYQLMLEYKTKYYEQKVNRFLSKIDLPEQLRNKLKHEMLQPITSEGIEYSNFMEEASRRISQSFQPLSGKIAEILAQKELEKNGLSENKHFLGGHKERTDLIVFHPDIFSKKAKHRIEVKNVKIRERAVRGLSFDGDSLIGYFDSAGEFTAETISIIDSLCTKNGGYFYIPPSIISILRSKSMLSTSTRIRPNTDFGKDMANFCNTGSI